ncbi:methyltransferase domain-containing protein [Streptomyces sp. NPDC055078]
MTAPTDAQPHMDALATRLRETGALRSPEWTAAFSAVPRHAFVPAWYEQSTDERGIAVWNLRTEADDERWLDAVYSDQTLVTALDPDTAEQVGERAWTGVATSSSTQPGLMAGMLEDLAVLDGHRVLEIGTGTGYNAALLCARLGEHLVHSVDVDPALIHAARQRLAGIGYTPQLVPYDGQDGYPTGERFDRIIATCSVPRIPAAWIEQTRPGGFVVADLDLGIDGGLVRLAVQRNGAARGHFIRTTGRFMPARSSATSYPRPVRAPYAPEELTRVTAVGAAEIRGHYGFRLLLALWLRDTELVYHLDDSGGMALQLQSGDGSWARTPVPGHPGEGTVTSGGDGRLWERVEDAWEWWIGQGRPDHTRCGITREADGSAHAWYAPDGRIWDLTS